MQSGLLCYSARQGKQKTMLNIIKYQLCKLADNVREADSQAAAKLAIRAKDLEG
jgi:hypothetical protein